MSEQIDSLAKIVALLEEEQYCLSQDGLDSLYDIFEHIVFGDTGPEALGFSIDEISVFLAIAWMECRDIVLARAEYRSEIENEDN